MYTEMVSTKRKFIEISQESTNMSEPHLPGNIGASQATTPHTEPRTLVQVFTQYTPVQDTVLANLEIRDVLSLSQAAKAFRDCYHIVKRTQFNIDEQLGRFFTWPLKFRSLQAEHNIIISGAFAFEFMARTMPGRNVTFEKSRLNAVVVEKGQHATALSELLSHEGYRLMSTTAEAITAVPVSLLTSIITSLC
jgi:hypothetical protein